METLVRFEDQSYILVSDMLGRGEIARVFPAFLDGTDPAQANWAIKLARDRRHNVYIEREYQTLSKLHGLTAVPALPIVKMGESTDGRKALIMQPLLRQSLLAVFESIEDPIARERLAISAAQQYTELLQAMADADISCRDRKLGDLWWMGDPASGQLIVTDWNVVDDAANQPVDIRRFGLLWFELLIGKQMLRDFQPRREGFDRVQDKISYGLWHTIGRAVGSSMRFQFRTAQELAETLSALADIYVQQPQTLISQARSDLEQALTQQDRSKADFAWIQFDIAVRLGAGDQSSVIDQARRLAQDTLTHNMPALIGILASSHFSEAAAQLQKLRDKALGPQELGDINRLALGFDFLNTTMGMWATAESASELAEASREFAEIQNLLVTNVLLALMEKNGPLAQNGLQQIEQSAKLPPEILEMLGPLEREAVFWESFQDALRDLDESPDAAIEAMEKAKRVRIQVGYWPALYEPAVEDIDRLKEVAESNRRTVILAGETSKRIKEEETSAFHAALKEDITKRRWGEAIAELVAFLEQNPENDKLQLALQQLLEMLLQQHVKLAQGRKTPRRLAEQAQVIDALLQIPSSLASGLWQEGQLQQELAEIRELEAKISQDQKALFKTPGQVLENALESGYELFDDGALSVPVLKTVHDVGWWNGDKLDQEAGQLEKKVEHLENMTEVLRGKKSEVEKTLAFFETWQQESPAKTKAFFSNTLWLYLTTAQAQIEKGIDANCSLERTELLLEFLQREQWLPPDECQVYQNLYQHLVELQGGELVLVENQTQQSRPSITEEQLEEWFKASNFEECLANLGELPGEEQRRQWETRVRHAIQLQNFLENGLPRLDDGYFKKKQNVRICALALDTLRRGAIESDPLAYALYQDRFQALYETTWHKLAQLDKKVAARFNSNIRNLSPPQKAVNLEENGRLDHSQ